MSFRKTQSYTIESPCYQKTKHAKNNPKINKINKNLQKCDSRQGCRFGKSCSAHERSWPWAPLSSTIAETSTKKHPWTRREVITGSGLKLSGPPNSSVHRAALDKGHQHAFHLNVMLTQATMPPSAEPQLHHAKERGCCDWQKGLNTCSRECRLREQPVWKFPRICPEQCCSVPVGGSLGKGLQVAMLHWTRVK